MAWPELHTEPDMIDDIALHRELRTLCRRYHLRRLDLIGSAARDDFDPVRSDVDFLVEFDRSHPEPMKFQTCLGLEESLEKLLGRSVDLVEESAVVNPYLLGARHSSGASSHAFWTARLPAGS